MELQQHASSPSLWDALVDSFRRFTASVDGHALNQDPTADVAFSDELERQLIQRELERAA